MPLAGRIGVRIQRVNTITMPIPRVHLFELEDLSWFPHIFRRYATDYLSFVEARLQLHRPAGRLLTDLLSRTGSRRIVDLCSGSSGPLSAPTISVSSYQTEIKPGRKSSY